MSRLMKVGILATAIGSAALGCTPKVQTRAQRAGSTTSSAKLSFALPASDLFALDSGDANNELTSYWYTLESESASCDPQTRKDTADYEGAETVQIKVVKKCDYKLALAIGKGKLAYYETEDALAIASGEKRVPVRLKRTDVGETAGFKNAWVESVAANDGENDDEDDAVEDHPVTDVVTYAEIKPLVDSNCVSCHKAGGSRPNSDLTTYAGVKNFAELVTEYSAVGRMPLPPATMDDAAKLLFKQWKVDGFLDIGDSKPTEDDEVQPSTTPPNGIVELRIANGTGTGAWNTEATPVVAKVGQTIRIFNDDSRVHQMHTNGAPCPHGSPIQPGKSGDCVVTKAFAGPSLYDHITEGKFFLRTER